MDAKEKVTRLVEMGFTTEEAIALANGNYKSVPDKKPAEDPDKKPEEDPDKKPAEDPDKKPAENQFSMDDVNKTIEAGFETLKKAIITANILGSEQPPEKSVDDILGTIINPKLPDK